MGAPWIDVGELDADGPGVGLRRRLDVRHRQLEGGDPCRTAERVGERRPGGARGFTPLRARELVLHDERRLRRAERRREGGAPADDLAVRAGARAGLDLASSDPPARRRSRSASTPSEATAYETSPTCPASSAAATARETAPFGARDRSNRPMSSTYVSPNQASRLNVPHSGCRPPPVQAKPTVRSSSAAAASGSGTAMTR